MSAPADFLIFLAVLAALSIAFRVVRYLRQRSRPSLGDANAYGNLIPPGEHQHPPGGQKSHGGGHTAHGGVQGGMHGGGHAGQGGIGGGHH